MSPRNLTTELDAAHPQSSHAELVDRILESQCFRSSLRMREFLRYVCDCEMRNAPEEATEQQIGMHVFRREPGYNSSEDSIVRTQARILRQKLGEYFSGEGSHEPVVLEIPKGHYLPIFVPRTVPVPYPPAPLAPAKLPEEEAAPALPPEKIASRRPWYWAAAALTVAVAFVAVWLSVTSRSAGQINRFWAPFFTGDNSLVVYSNALFAGNSTDGLRYASADAPPIGGAYVDTYTGIGELASVYDLARLFDSHGASFLLKRSRLVTWDQAKLSNLIFVGSIAENPSLRLLPGTTEFTMTAGNGFSGIVNHHPRPGEQATYSRPEQPLTHDYAIIALLPGIQPGSHMLIYSGLTTLGTQAAVEFTCHPDTLQQLMEKVSGPHGEIKPFEAVVDATIIGGVPLEAKLIAVHLR